MTPTTAIPLTVIVLTYNEEKNLQQCLRSVSGWTESIFVIDSGSSDRTVEIAENCGAPVFEHPFKTHTAQWCWALESLPIRTDFVLGLDADQRVSPELRDELIWLFSQEQTRLDAAGGFYAKRRQVFRGQWIRHGGYYPKHLLKLFRRDKVFFDENDFLDHHFYVRGRIGILGNDLIEDNHNENDIAFWIEKHNRYAQLHAKEEMLRRGNGALESPVKPELFGSPDQRSLWFKKRWLYLPLYVRPFLYFFYRYFFKLGFLDGKQGFIFHFLHAFWYRLLVDIHVDEMRKTGDRTGGPETEERQMEAEKSQVEPEKFAIKESS